MFVEKREIRHVDEFAKLSDLELLQLVEQETRKLLEDQSSGDGGKDGKDRS